MVGSLFSSFRVKDVRERILYNFLGFTIFCLAVHITVPGVDLKLWNELLGRQELGQFLGMFTGGALNNFSIIAMGITPYINASIIMQLLTHVIPKLHEMQKEGGEHGRRQISKYVRWGTIGLGILQATMMTLSLARWSDQGRHLFYYNVWYYYPLVVMSLTAGTAFLMWLGEQITDKGIGNGVSLIIFAGIVLRFPDYIGNTFKTAQMQGPSYYVSIVLFLIITVLLIMSIIMINQGQRRVPVQYAKRQVGRRVYGGQSTYIPIRINNAGVISIIFAISIMYLPTTFTGFLKQSYAHREAAINVLPRVNINGTEYDLSQKGLTIPGIKQTPQELWDNLKKLDPEMSEVGNKALLIDLKSPKDLKVRGEDVSRDKELYLKNRNVDIVDLTKKRDFYLSFVVQKTAPRLEWWSHAVNFVDRLFDPGGWFYNLCYALLVIFFTYFYSAITFNIMDVADNMKKYGGFVPGIRPGRPTAEYLDRILGRITFVSAFFLAFIAVAPTYVMKLTNVHSFYLGSTSILIIVGVALDTMQQIEARLVMRHYQGFMK